MTDPTAAQERDAAINALLAAAVAWRAEALDTAEVLGLNGTEANLAAAVNRYLATRGSLDAARDDFLTRYPTVNAMQAELARRYPALHRQPVPHGCDGDPCTVLHHHPEP
jgi:hypothetical protein